MHSTLPRPAVKALPAAQVDARWLHRPIPACPAAGTPTQPGLLAIAGHQGDVVYLATPHVKLLTGEVYGWRLTKSDGQTYDLPADLSSCECRDFAYRGQRRPGGCKHTQGLRLALVAIAWPASQPLPPRPAPKMPAPLPSPIPVRRAAAELPQDLDGEPEPWCELDLDVANRLAAKTSPKAPAAAVPVPSIGELMAMDTRPWTPYAGD